MKLRPSRNRSRAVTALLLFALALAPSLAAACPACMGQEARLSDVLKVVGAFMLVPFLVAGTVLWTIRAAQNGEHSGSSKSPPEL